MAITLPSETVVSEVLGELGRVDEAELRSALDDPKLALGLDPWSLWLLICLSRHIERQKWVGYVVESRLRGDLNKIGHRGYFGHPEDCDQRGEVPDFPEWNYLFHGKGCCLTHKIEGTEIDVDFTNDGRSTQIDPYFYTNFLDSLKNPEFPELALKAPSALHNHWQVDLDNLEQEGCWLDREVTDLGTRISDVLVPIVDHLCKTHGRSDRESKLQVVYLSLQLGDCVHSEKALESLSFSEGLIREIKGRARTAKTARAKRLASLISGPDGKYGIILEALAKLGSEFSKPDVVKCLFRSPVDGAANRALEILTLWEQDDLDATFEKLVEFRVAERSNSVSFQLFRGKPEQTTSAEEMARDSQFVRLARFILLRQREGLKPATRLLLIKGLNKVRTASQGKAAFLLYLLDRETGLEALNRSLADKVPMSNYDAAAACVLISSKETKQVLIRALKNPQLEKQHAAACALNRLEANTQIPELSDWLRVQDGISDPLGNETKIDGRTISTYTMSDVAHASMQNSIDWAIKDLDDLAQML